MIVDGCPQNLSLQPSHWLSQLISSPFPTGNPHGVPKVTAPSKLNLLIASLYHFKTVIIIESFFKRSSYFINGMNELNFRQFDLNIVYFVWVKKNLIPINCSSTLKETSTTSYFTIIEKCLLQISIRNSSLKVDMLISQLYTRFWELTLNFYKHMNFRSKPLLSTDIAYKKAEKPLSAEKSGWSLYVP